MKTDVNTILNKLTTFACDNLMLDALDYTYTLNRLASIAGVTPKVVQDVDYGDSDLNALVAELKSALPAVDGKAVVETLMPLAHTIDYYFTDALGRNTDKAFEFIFDLFAQCGSVSDGVKLGANGYTFYTAADGQYSVSVNVGGDNLVYTPVSAVGKVACLECPDLLAYDVAQRLAAFADEYKMSIAKTAGDDGAYLCCKEIALDKAKVKEKLAEGVVKTSLLDYPVPALSVVGPKNAAARECARIMKAAADANVKCVVAASPGQFTTMYVVFAGPIAKDDYFVSSDALTACGAVKTVDFAPLLPVLEKGTALSTDLSDYKAVYNEVGGVKHGAKAASALSDALVKKFAAVLKNSASADEATVKGLAVEQK